MAILMCGCYTYIQLMEANFNSILALVFFIVFDIIGRIFALGYIPNNRKPGEATAWLMAIFFLPFFGWIIFLFFGNSKLSQKRRNKQLAINELVYSKTHNQSAIETENNPPDWLLSLATLNSKLGALPMLGGNHIDSTINYKDSIKQMTKAINNSKTYVHLEFYIMSKDSTTQELLQSLADAKKRGVTVRVLFDHVGSLQYPGYKKMINFFKNNEINFHRMLPILPLQGKFQRPDLRNHRKLLVIDGNIGFMGSQNLIDSTYNKKKNIKKGLHWLDIMLKLKGPIVHELDTVFIGDWYAESDELLTQYVKHEKDSLTDYGDNDCQLVPSGPGFEAENNLKFFVSLMYNAKNKIILTSPYFVPDESMLTAVTTAAQRGLKVELYVSEVGDQMMVYHAQRSYYEALLRAGVKIYLYKSPYVLHSKHFTVDDDVAVVGSSNMDMRSFNLNMEISLLVYSKDFVKTMRRIEKQYKDDSLELTLDVWMKRPRHEKFVDNALRLTSALQ